MTDHTVQNEGMKFKESSLIKYFMYVCPSVSLLVRFFVRQTLVHTAPRQ